MQVSNATKRIRKDLEDMRNDPSAVCSAGPIDDKNIFYWHAVIFGPGGTPYEGGAFTLGIHFPFDYPSKPPQIKFLTQIFHPNISIEGEICVDFLKEETWIPDYSIGKALIAVDCLLHHPNPDSALNGDAARLYKKDIHQYNQRATDITRVFANPP